MRTSALCHDDILDGRHLNNERSRSSATKICTTSSDVFVYHWIAPLSTQEGEHRCLRARCRRVILQPLLKSLAMLRKREQILAVAFDRVVECHRLPISAVLL